MPRHRKPPEHHRHASFVGREKVLSTLREAFRRVQQGTTVQAFVHGSSGMGKTTLVRKFLRQLGEEERVLAVSRAMLRVRVDPL